MNCHEGQDCAACNLICNLNLHGSIRTRAPVALNLSMNVLTSYEV
jgi:hypothetical protein